MSSYFKGEFVQTFGQNWTLYVIKVYTSEKKYKFFCIDKRQSLSIQLFRKNIYETNSYNLYVTIVSAIQFLFSSNM